MIRIFGIQFAALTHFLNSRCAQYSVNSGELWRCENLPRSGVEPVLGGGFQKDTRPPYWGAEQPHMMFDLSMKQHLTKRRHSVDTSNHPQNIQLILYVTVFFLKRLLCQKDGWRREQFTWGQWVFSGYENPSIYGLNPGIASATLCQSRNDIFSPLAYPRCVLGCACATQRGSWHTQTSHAEFFFWTSDSDANAANSQATLVYLMHTHLFFSAYTLML